MSEHQAHHLLTERIPPGLKRLIGEGRLRAVRIGRTALLFRADIERLAASTLDMQ